MNALHPSKSLWLLILQASSGQAFGGVPIDTWLTCEMPSAGHGPINTKMPVPH